MHSKSMAILYFWVILMFVGLFALFEAWHRPPPITAQQLADRLCQELYGPQTGAIWTEGMQCQTVRGEILPVRKP